jgi:hypothetical protein
MLINNAKNISDKTIIKYLKIIAYKILFASRKNDLEISLFFS